MRGQRFAVTIESSGLKPGAIADESNGACSSSGRHGVLGDARSRRSPIRERACAIGIQTHNDDRRVGVKTGAIHKPRLGVRVSVNRWGKARAQFKTIRYLPRNEVTFIVALENVAACTEDLHAIFAQNTLTALDKRFTQIVTFPIDR